MLWEVRGWRVRSRLENQGSFLKEGVIFEGKGEFAVVEEAGHRSSFHPDLSCPKPASSGVRTWQRGLFQ